MSRIPFAFLFLALILHVAACDDSDSEWETGRAALGGIAADQAQTSQRWDVYRDEIVRGLDLMRDALSEAREQGAVVDRHEIDRLAKRVGSLREDMASKVDEPPQAEQRTLRATFESVRADVDALLTRLGYDPDEIARWQDKT